MILLVGKNVLVSRIKPHICGEATWTPCALEFALLCQDIWFAPLLLLQVELCVLSQQMFSLVLILEVDLRACAHRRVVRQSNL